MYESVPFHCETCGEDFEVVGTLLVFLGEDPEAYFDPIDGETTNCPNEPPFAPETNGTSYTEHDVSLDTRRMGG